MAHHTLILFAVRPEAMPLVRRLRGVLSANHAWRVERSGHDLSIVVTGMGRDRARAALEDQLRRHQVDHVIVAGLAGGLAPHLAAGDIVEPARVIDAVTGQQWNVSGASGDQVLLTGDRVVETPAEKQTLRARFSADLVDMETAAIADGCSRARVDWSVIRGISDAADQGLPPGLTAIVDPQGRPRPGALAAFLLHRPWQIPELIRLGRRSTRAAMLLAQRLEAVWADR